MIFVDHRTVFSLSKSASTFLLFMAGIKIFIICCPHPPDDAKSPTVILHTKDTIMFPISNIALCMTKCLVFLRSIAVATVAGISILILFFLKNDANGQYMVELNGLYKLFKIHFLVKYHIFKYINTKND